MNRITLIILLITFSLPSFCASWSNGSQTVNNIIWRPGYKGFYVPPSTYQDVNNCGDTTNLYVVDTTLSEKEIDRLYSIILTAFTTGKKLHLWLDGCQGKIPKFTGLQINK